MTPDASLLLSGILLTAVSGIPSLLYGRRSFIGQWITTALAVVGCGCGLVGVYRQLGGTVVEVVRFPSPIPQADVVLAADSLSATAIFH